MLGPIQHGKDNANYRRCVKRPEGSCQPCKDITAKYKRRQVLFHHRGYRAMVKPDRAIAHLEGLREQGMGLAKIAIEAGVSVTTILRLHRGQAKWLTRTNEAKILAVDLKLYRLPPECLMFRVHALNAHGYGWQFIRDRGIGISRASHKWCFRGTVEALLELCREVESTPGPNDGSRAYAHKNGHIFTPVAYPEHLFYDPAWHPGLDEEQAWAS